MPTTYTPFRQYNSCGMAMCRGCPPFINLTGGENGGGGDDGQGGTVPLGPTGVKMMHYCFAARTECCSCETYEPGNPKTRPTGSGPPSGPTEEDFKGPPTGACGVVSMTWWNLDTCKVAPAQKRCCGDETEFKSYEGLCIFAEASTGTMDDQVCGGPTKYGDICCPGVEQAHACGECGGCDTPCPPLHQITGAAARAAICACCACESEEWGCYDDQEPCGKQWDVAAKGWITKGNCGGGDPPIDDPPIDDPPIDPPPECPDPPCGGGACP